MKKHTYEQPLAEIFELNLQENVLQGTSPVPGGAGSDDEVDNQGEF